MRPISILQHDPESPAGSIVDTLDDLCVSYEIVRLYAGDRLPGWADIAGVISLGGRIEVKQTREHTFLKDEIGLLRRIVHEGGPVWGIGLGAELLTMATGGEVYQRRRPEVGWVSIDKIVDDPLLRGISSPFMGFCWHTHSCKLPATSHLTAEHQGEVQAFRAGGRAWATQFHPEMHADTLAQWIEHGAQTHHDLDPEFVRRLRAQTQQLFADYATLGRRMTTNFIAASGLLPEE
ncbi:MAG: type 1 glutamine amidotransferase [Thermoleophilia bacterium]|mgnify:CR=1 FL=1